MTTRVHSRYGRTLADLPWAGLPVRIRLQVRKFFCVGSSCPRRIFTVRHQTAWLILMHFVPGDVRDCIQDLAPR